MNPLKWVIVWIVKFKLLDGQLILHLGLWCCSCIHLVNCMQKYQTVKVQITKIVYLDPDSAQFTVTHSTNTQTQYVFLFNYLKCWKWLTLYSNASKKNDERYTWFSFIYWTRNGQLKIERINNFVNTN